MSLEAEISFNKIQYPFVVKAPRKPGTEGMYLSIIKTIYDKHRQHHTKQRNSETISSKVRNETRKSTSPLLLNVELEFLARAIRKEKEIKESK
jgi:hypothetical protein